ncbi:MAG: hypothetical protein WC225_01290 [Acholeplasmataceae bacterium]|nr:hypothetical protein [Acholeplasmataceae bacterium]
MKIVKSVIFVVLVLLLASCGKESPEIDKPEYAITGEQNDDGEYIGSATLTITGNLAIYYQIDNGEWQLYETAVTFDEAGQYVVKMKLRDEDANEGEVVNAEFTIVAIIKDPLELALENTSALTNYQLLIKVTHRARFETLVYEMTLSFTENVTLFEMDEQDIVYYEFTDTVINQYTKTGNTYLKEVVDEIDDFQSLNTYDFTWFTDMDDYYLLGSQHVSKVSNDILTYFPEGTISNFTIQIEDELIRLLSFDLIVDEETYQIEFTYDLIGQVSLELPTV